MIIHSAFYEAMFFSPDDENVPIVRGIDSERVKDELLSITKNNGVVEIYEFIFNEQGFRRRLVKRIPVINELKLFKE